MTQGTAMARLLAALLIVALPAPGLAARAEPATGGLTGVIRAANNTPLAGARLLATEDAENTVFRSEPTTDDGNFSLGELEPGTYRLAVEVDEGIYLVRYPVPVVAGVNRAVQIALGETADASSGRAAPETSVWNNPYTAGAIVLGVAIVVGILIKNVTDDEAVSSEI